MMAKPFLFLLGFLNMIAGIVASIVLIDITGNWLYLIICMITGYTGGSLSGYAVSEDKE